MSSIKTRHSTHFLTKLGIRLGIPLLLLMWLAPSVAACSPPYIAATITCLNGQIQRIPIEQADQFLKHLSPICDVGRDGRVLAQEVKQWKENWKGYFLDGGLTIIPYDAHQEQMIRQTDGDILSCHVSETKRSGMWLLIQETTRTYCHSKPFTRCCECPTIQLSLFEFAIYLVSDIRFSSLPYLGVLVSSIVGMAIVILRLAKRNELLYAIRPRIGTIILALVCAIFFLGQFAVTPIDVVGWSIVAYIVASAIMYVVRRYTPVQESSN